MKNIIDIEIQDIISGDNPNSKQIDHIVTLHTVDSDIILNRVHYIEHLRDYNENIGDYSLIRFGVTAGYYITKIHQYRGNLELSIDNRRYKLVLMSHNENIDASLLSRMSPEELDKASLLELEGQLLLRELEALRNSYVDGVYRDITIKDLLYGVFFNLCEDIQIEGSNLDLNIDIVDPVNELEFPHIVLPTGLKAMSLPSYLQNKAPGVYNGAIGTYLQDYRDKLTLFVYPLYTAERFNTATRKVLFYHPNTHYYNLLESSYRVDGDIIKILAGTDTENHDIAGDNLINKGESIISSNPEQVLNRNVDIGDEDITYDKSKQVKGITLEGRQDGYKKARYLPNSSNIYYTRSKLIRDTMMVYRITWRYSNPSLIYPGMPCVFIFEKDAKLVKYYGTIQYLYTKYDGVEKTYNSMIVIMVSRYYNNDE